jgi:multicomponent K+:H+ antiporter subunit F
MNTFFNVAATFAAACCVGAMLLALARLVRGPSAQDRVLAFDSFYVSGMLALLIHGIRGSSAVYFDVALLIGLFGFVGTTVLARFLSQGEVIQP